MLFVYYAINNCPDALLWKFSKDEMDSVEKNIKDIEKIPKTLNEVNNELLSSFQKLTL